VPIQAFLDESGGAGQSQHFVLAGFIGEAEKWAAFSDDWRAACEKEPAVSPFKMREAANFRGAFAGWSAAARDRRVRELADILAGYRFTSFHAITEIASFQRTIAGGVRRPWAQPYVYSFQFAVMGIAYEMLERGHTERIEVIFDEQVIFAPRALRWYELIKGVADDDVKAIMPIQPLFRSDAEFLPLQAADMLAWLYRKDVGEEAHSFGWLAAIFNSMNLSEHSQYVDDERMTFQVTMSRDPTLAARAIEKIENAAARGEISL
jgi:hypothetical protein